MADQEVDILITTKTAGEEAIKEASSNVESLNTSLTKEIPVLQQVNPLINFFGLSALMSTAAVGSLGVEVMKAGQAYDAFMVSQAALGVQINENTIGPLRDQADIEAELEQLHKRTGIPLKDLIEAYQNLSPSVLAAGIGIEVLSDAATLYNQGAGASLIENVQNLTKAYDEGLITRGLAPGMEAFRAMETIILQTANPALAEHRESANKTGSLWESVTNTIGQGWDALVSAFVNGWELKLKPQLSTEEMTVLTLRDAYLSLAAARSVAIPGENLLKTPAYAADTSAAIASPESLWKQIDQLASGEYYGATSGIATGTNGEKILNINVDGKVLTSVVLENVNDDVRLRGGGAQ